MKNDMGFFNWQTKKEMTKQEAQCPFCLTFLPEIPQRHFKCDGCKKKVFVFKFDSRLVLTDDEGAKKYRWLKKIDGTLDDFQKKKTQLASRFGKEPSDRDVLWGLLQDSNNYWMSAEFLDEEGRDPKNALMGLFLKQLNEHKKSGVVKSVQVWTALDERTCEDCAKQHGVIVPLDVAIKSMPLPNRKCTSMMNSRTSKHGWCRCTYLPQIE